MRKLNIIFLFLISQISFASNVINSKNSDLNITIYNNNLSFINEVRTINIKKGKQQLIYENIPSSVITQSVIPSFTGVDVSLYSQNYIYNLVNLSSMLKHSVDKQIKFKKRGSENTYKISTGILLSTNPALVKEKGTNNIISVEAKDIVFNKVPKNMITKPSLVWNIDSANSGKVMVDLKYLTKGISWNSDYVLNLNKNSLDLNAWVTIANNSGVDFNNANIQFLAGQVNQAKGRRVLYKKNKNHLDMQEQMSGTHKVREESFSGYHLYTIPFKESILNKQQKQIAFINEQNINYLQYGLSTNDSFYNAPNKQKLTFKNVIEFVNTKKNNLGIPLPKGVVRMYKKDAHGKTHFIGEDRIQNIPNKETVKLTIGTLFDVVGDRKTLKYVNKKNYKYVKANYSVRNRGKEAIVLKIKERNSYSHKNSVFKSNCDNNCSVKKVSAFYREFTIKLQGEETYDFNSSVEINK